jgi:ABC-type sugar transport system ATPase subunit
VLRLADRISVLRDGRLVATRQRGEVTVDEMIRLMVGRALDETAARAEKRTMGATLLEVQNLSAPPRVREVSFELHRGEILGIAGLMGSGRTEAMRAIFGADPRRTGKILFNG